MIKGEIPTTAIPRLTQCVRSYLREYLTGLGDRSLLLGLMLPESRSCLCESTGGDISVSVSSSTKNRRRDLGVSSGNRLRLGVASGSIFRLGSIVAALGAIGLDPVAQRPRIQRSRIATAAS